MTDIEELKKLAEAATPGPWRFSRKSWNVSTPDCDTDISVYIPEAEEDMTGEFIAAANPQTVLALIRELEEARKDADFLRGLLKTAQSVRP